MQPETPKLKNLTDWFDHVLVINCAHRPDRKKKVMEHLESTGLADISKVVVYPAIIGDYTRHPAGWGSGNGAWGCLQSHRRIMEDLMHIRDERGDITWQSALILEDDVFFVDGALQALNDFMPNVPGKWGQIYLGGQHRKNAEKTSHPAVMKANSVNRTHAYAIARDSIHRIYHHISYMPDYIGTNKHIDHQLELAHQRGDWKVYCPAKWIAGQEAGTSNISGKKNGRNLWE